MSNNFLPIAPRKGHFISKKKIPPRIYEKKKADAHFYFMHYLKTGLLKKPGNSFGYCDLTSKISRLRLAAFAAGVPS